MSVSPDRSKLIRPVEEWSKIISFLRTTVPNMIELHSTDHEYRTDDRQIVKWRGRPINKSVDGLPHNTEDDRQLIVEMLSVYYQLQDQMGN
jgi:hypothetical protein